MLLGADKYLQGFNATEFNRLLKIALEKWNIFADDSEWDALVKIAIQIKDVDKTLLCGKWF